VSIAVKTAKRYPGPTLRGAKFAVRHRKRLMKTIRMSRKMKKGGQRLAVRAADPGFRTELLSAFSALGAAGKRSRSLGVSKSVEDERMRRLVREATRHFATALEEPKAKRHTVRNLAVAAAVVGGAAVAYSRFGSSLRR
jgi:hypothetical protein